MTALTDFLPLPADVAVMAIRKGYRSRQDAVVVVVRSAAPNGPAACAHCDTPTVRNGMRATHFRDEPSGGHPVVLEWRRQSRLCRICGRSALEEHPLFDPRRGITPRLRAWLVAGARDTTLTALAQRCGLDERSARRILVEAADPETPDTPSGVVSLTSVPLVGRARPVLVDPIGRRVIEVWRDPDELALGLLTPRQGAGLRPRLLLHSPDPGYAALAALYGAETRAVSRLDLLRAADESVSRASRSALVPAEARLFQRRRSALGRHVRRRLDAWERSEPGLVAAYEAKEAFYETWIGLETAEDVDVRYATWLRRVEALDAQANPLVLPLRDLVDHDRSAIRAFYVQQCESYDLAAAVVVQKALARIGRKRNFVAARRAMLSTEADPEG